MKFTITPESKMLKKQIIEQKKEIELKIDSLTFWFSNRLPSYL